MMVREKKRPSYKGQTQKPMAQPYDFPAPIRGWILNESLVAPGPAGARALDNFICTPTTIKVRGGFSKHATVGSPTAVASLFTYKSGSAEKFFAATASAIYDISAPADPDVSPSAAVSGQTAGKYATAQFATAGGEYLYAVNGADNAQLYDGSTWTQITGVSSPAITGVNTDTFSHVFSFANRLWFVEGGTMNAWYLSVDSIGGAANSFSLAGVFKKGGSLLFGATWSLDSGDGLDDKCVFVSTEGEVAVYQGTNPASASEWSKVGVYQITRPLGMNATMQAGGDLLIATETGLVPVSEAVRRDVAALSIGAASRAIEPYWQTRAKVHSAVAWEVVKWPAENLMLVSQPETTATVGSMLVANLQTGAWSRFTGMDSQCLGVFGGTAYFGDSNGYVYQMENTGSDNGAVYTAVCLWQADQMGMPGLQKTVEQMRPIFNSSTPIAPSLRALVNFSEELSSVPNAVTYDPTDGWDVSVWDTSLWDASPGANVRPEDSQWIAIGRTGHAIAPELMLSFGSSPKPDAELIGISATFMPGALVA